MSRKGLLFSCGTSARLRAPTAASACSLHPLSYIQPLNILPRTSLVAKRNSLQKNPQEVHMGQGRRTGKWQAFEPAHFYKPFKKRSTVPLKARFPSVKPQLTIPDEGKQKEEGAHTRPATHAKMPLRYNTTFSGECKSSAESRKLPAPGRSRPKRKMRRMERT